MDIARESGKLGLALCACLAGAALALSSAKADQNTGTRVLGSGTLNDPPRIELLSSRPDGIDLEFTLPALAVEDVQLEGTTYQMIAIPQGGEIGQIGQPMMPTFGSLVAIPDRAGVRISAVVEEETEYDGYRLLPMQEESGTSFAYDPSSYAEDSFGDAPMAQAGEPALLRDLRVTALNFAPVRFNPAQGKLRVAHRMRVQVSFVGEDLTNARTQDNRPIASSFDRLYRALVVNYEQMRGERTVAPGSWLIICPNNSTVVDKLQPLVTWRQRKGTPATLVTTATTGTTKEAIKAYIQTAYNTWSPRPEYVVLAADADGSYALPTWHENLSGETGPGDHPYTQLDGTDVLSDVHIGRVSFSSTTDLDAIVNKIVGYESTPYMTDTAWYTRACLVGDPNDSGYSCVQVMQSIKTRLRQMGYAQIDTVFSGNFVTQMSTALNRGDTIFSYRGYYQMSGWTNSNTNALTNGWKLSFATMCTCGTGTFEGGTSRSEGFLRANSSPTSPKGAVGAIGTATLGTHTRFNNCYTYGVMGGLIWDGLWEQGAATTRGKLELYRNYFNSSQSNWVTIFSYWNNLMGDPACETWTAVPAPISVSHVASLAVGANSVTVTVNELGNPTPDAQVCLWKGTETYVVGRTNALGQVELPVSLTTAGNLLLTVTKHDHQPYLATIPVAVQPRFVSYLSNQVSDDNVGASHGNGNGQVNPGESIELRVQVQNFGSNAVTGISANLTSSDPYVTISYGSSTYPDLNPGQSAWSNQYYVFTVDPGCPHGQMLKLGLQVQAGTDQWHSLINIPVVSARMDSVITCHFTDGGNGVLDPGETAQLSVDVINSGGLNADTPVAYLYSLSEYITVPFPTGHFPTINASSHAENVSFPFTVHADPGTFRGYRAHMKMVLEFSGGMRDTTFFAFTVGQRASSDPIGPDGYGYWCFDNTDTAYPSYAPTYSWVEIDPAYGGSGTEIVLGDYADYQDKTRLVTMPFNFKYYGTSYSQASVCSNGWIVMGSTYLTNYRNWAIPSLGGPNGAIAVFWDDLYQVSGTSKAYHWYDSANHRWIVEWSRFRCSAGNGTETFEAIFYDPAYYPTDTGDGIICFQYNAVVNQDGTDGYATVGIEKPDNSTGIQYTYFNVYPVGAPSLATGRAIRFVPMADIPLTTGLTLLDRPTFALSPGIPNPFHPGSALGFSMDRLGVATLQVFDVQGRVVRRLWDGPAAAGTHAVIWNGRDENGRGLPSGIYFYRLTAEGREETRKAIMVR